MICIGRETNPPYPLHRINTEATAIVFHTTFYIIIREEYKAAVFEKADGEIPGGYFHPTKVIAEQNGIKIQVDVSMTAEIFFKTPVPLPDGYNFSDYSSIFILSRGIILSFTIKTGI